MKSRVFHGFLKNAGCTPREIDVMMLLFYNESEHTTADKLGLKWSSVRAYKARATKKLRASQQIRSYLIGTKTDSDPCDSARISPSDSERPARDRSK